VGTAISSHKSSDAGAAEAVYRFLRRFGEVEYFKPSTTAKGPKMFATALFTQREAAIAAIAAINSHINSDLRELELSAARIVSIKYNVPADLGDAIQAELESFSK